MMIGAYFRFHVFGSSCLNKIGRSNVAYNQHTGFETSTVDIRKLCKKYYHVNFKACLQGSLFYDYAYIVEQCYIR